VRSAIAILIVGSVIATLGAAAIVVHAFRRRSRERFLLWFGLFPIFYGIVLIIRNEVFRLGFGDPGQVGVSIERLITMATAVPGLLLFEEFYGPGWRSSIWWLLAAYSAFSAAAIVGMVSAHHFRLIFPPGVMLVITVPTILVVGRLAGYKPHAAAAHPPGLVWRRGRQELEKLDGEGLLLGVRPNECYAAREVSFETGDRLLLYSTASWKRRTAMASPLEMRPSPLSFKRSRTWERSNLPTCCQGAFSTGRGVDLGRGRRTTSLSWWWTCKTTAKLRR